MIKLVVVAVDAIEHLCKDVGAKSNIGYNFVQLNNRLLLSRAAIDAHSDLLVAMLAYREAKGF